LENGEWLFTMLREYLGLLRRITDDLVMYKRASAAATTSSGSPPTASNADARASLLYFLWMVANEAERERVIHTLNAGLLSSDKAMVHSIHLDWLLRTDELLKQLKLATIIGEQSNSSAVVNVFRRTVNGRPVDGELLVWQLLDAISLVRTLRYTVEPLFRTSLSGSALSRHNSETTFWRGALELNLTV
jgi:hypothetical protein